MRVQLNGIIGWCLDRLSENSTWRGFIALAAASGVILKPDQAEHIIAAGLALIGLINVFRKAPVSAGTSTTTQTTTTTHEANISTDPTASTKP